ncbi:MAG: hypothetical protein IPG72_07595 [Ardenticatenales bacterium]|nr:hypothetical protein [Ardenticatenales bacterium]
MSDGGTHELPDLRIVELARVVPHEDFDERRILALAERLVREEVLKDPPIVAPLGDGRFVVLDGANRTSALKHLGYRDALVQVVDYDAVALSTWHHLVVGLSAQALAAGLSAIPGLATDDATLPEAKASLKANDATAYVVYDGGATVTLSGGSDLVGRCEMLRRVVSVYNGRADIHRVRASELGAIDAHYDDVGGLVVFPAFTPDDILSLVREGGVLPSGISRHVIPGRALRLHFSMAILADEAPRDEKNRHLIEWIRRKRQANQIRAYDEPTVLYDE